MNTVQSPTDIAASFDRRAARYNENEWHRRCAERLVELVAVEPGRRVLDAATGTGFAALAVARQLATGGRVVGVDLSAGMLREAAIAARDAGLTNIDWLQADATSLPQFANGSFDAVTCAAGLLYMPVDAALSEWRRLLRPGGSIAFTTMKAGSPLTGRIFRDHAAAFGIVLTDPSEELGSSAACSAALTGAGFEPISIREETIALSAQDLTVAWDSNVKSPAHAGVRQLSAEQMGMFRRRYLDALAHARDHEPDALTRGDILYAIGRR